MAKKQFVMLVTDMIKIGKEAQLEKLMLTKVRPAIRKHLPDFKWRVYRPVIANLSLMVVIAQLSAENVLRYDEWLSSALEKEYGADGVAAIYAEWFSCLDSSEYKVMVEEPDWSNP